MQPASPILITGSERELKGRHPNISTTRNSRGFTECYAHVLILMVLLCHLHA